MTRFAHTAAGILSHSSIQVFSRSFRFWGCRWATRSFSSLHRFSIGFRSGDSLGHSRTLKCFLRSHSLVALAVCLGSLSCWKTQPRPIFNALTEVVAQNLVIHGPIHPPLNTVQSSCPLCRKAPPKHDVSTPMLHGWDGVLGIVLILLLPPNTASGEFIPKSYILVSSDHMTFSHASGSSRWSLANFRWAWTCAGLSRGTLHALQDFNPWRCSVLLMVTVETVVPALLQVIDQVLPCSSRRIPHLSQDHWYSTRRDLAWSPSPREIDSHLEFLPFSNNCANSCCLLTKLFAYCPVAHPSLVQVYNFVPSVLRQLFGLAHSGEVGVWLIECVNSGLLYR